MLRCGAPRVISQVTAMLALPANASPFCKNPNNMNVKIGMVDEGFLWNGARYDSLSAIAFAITGTRWNGPRFFGLRDGTVGGGDGP